MTHVLLAEFATAHAAEEAVARAAQAGIPPQDVLSPHPLEGIVGHLSPRPAKAPIGWVMYVAGTLGALAGYGMQWYSAVIDYPINSGGRPLNSWPAFLLVPYETTILAAAVVGILALLWMCGLPTLFHPLFGAATVERASQDRYLLVFPFEEELSAKVQKILAPQSISELRE